MSPLPVPSRRAYVPALDGLRAVAVLAVLAYHLDAPWAKGGYLGVDVFFVLSGYLITGLLVEEVGRTSRVDVVAFWARRARRLLPALLLMIGVLLLWALWWADPVARGRFRGDGLASLFYVANWRFIASDASYFDTFAAGNPLTHLWSLAIEEQFYLVWPLVVFGLGRLARTPARLTRWLAVGCAVGAVVSAVLMAWWYDGGDASRVYYGTDTHAFGLLIGALGAVLPHPVRFRRVAALGGLAGFVVVVSAMVALADDSSLAYTGGIALVSLITLPVVMSASVPGLVRIGLSWRPLVGLGKVSYGLYLWHWPVIVVLDARETDLDGPALLAVRLVTIVALTAASYMIVEQPIRRRRIIPTGLTAGPAALVCASVLVVSLVSVDGSPAVFASPIDVSTLADTPVDEAEPGTDVAAATAVAEPRRSLLVVGDSTGASLLLGLPSVADDIGVDVIPAAVVPGQASTFCPLDLSAAELRFADGAVTDAPIAPECDWSATWPVITERLDPEVTLMVFGMWDTMPRRVAGAWLEPGTTEWHDHMVAQTVCAIAVLTQRGSRVAVLAVPPSPTLAPTQVDALNAVFADAVAIVPDRASVVDVGALVDSHPDWRWDGTHYTASGATATARAILDELAADLDRPALEDKAPPPWCPDRSAVTAS